jgi:ribose 1,5-bisphosphokinase PhnN
MKIKVRKPLYQGLHFQQNRYGISSIFISNMLISKWLKMGMIYVLRSSHAVLPMTKRKLRKLHYFQQSGEENVNKESKY